MNTHNFKILVNGLEDLREEHKNSKFDIGYSTIPNCGRNGCLAGLISVVACDMPDLFNIHRKAKWTDKFNEYEPTGWAYTLKVFLGCNFAEWARDNPEIWGCKCGMYMWHSKTAFGVKDHEKLTHDMMIVCFRKALDKWIAFENKSNEHQYPTEQ